MTVAADKKALASIDEILHDGEKVAATLRAVLSISNSSNANPSGVLALTGERVIFSGTARHTITLLTHPLTDIRSIEFERSVLNSFLRLRTGDAADPAVTTFRPDPGRAQAFVDAVTAAIARAQSAGAAPDPAAPASFGSDGSGGSGHTAPTPGSSTADELAKIADLHDRGALTDDEFAAAKAKILRT
jgi:hypothetical protein